MTIKTGQIFNPQNEGPVCYTGMWNEIHEIGHVHGILCKYVVINTLKGLFKYKRLPLGVSSIPEIFQRLMESLLRGIPKVIVYLYDILINRFNADFLTTVGNNR